MLLGKRVLTAVALSRGFGGHVWGWVGRNGEKEDGRGVWRRRGWGKDQVESERERAEERRRERILLRLRSGPNKDSATWPNCSAARSPRLPGSNNSRA